jgi:hypothetical protein
MINLFVVYIPLTRALTEALGVGVPNVSVGHDDIFSKERKREREKERISSINFFSIHLPWSRRANWNKKIFLSIIDVTFTTKPHKI